MLATIASMHEGHGDLLWDAFALLMLGVIDLRITRGGWSRVSADFGDDPAVRHDPGRRDWIELHLSSLEDIERLGPLLRTAMAANA